MSKQLFAECLDVRIKSLTIKQFQVQVGSDNKWQAVLSVNGQLIDTDGNLMPIPPRGINKTLLGTPKTDYWTWQQILNSKDLIFTKLGEIFNSLQFENTGNSTGAD